MAASGLIHAAVVASLVALVVAQQPGSSWQYPKFFNYTIADTSAMWDYFPPPTADDASRHTWNNTFSASNWTTYVPGQAGVGESGHFANGSNSPGLYLNFPMTSFQILGEVRGLNYSTGVGPPLQMIIDSRTPMNCTPTPGVICSATNLIWAFHKIQISLFSGNWTVRGIQVTTGAAIKTDTLEDTKIQSEPFVYENNTLNPFFNFSGEWLVWDKLGGPGGQEPIPYRTLVGQNSASVNVTVPPKTAWVVLNGSVRPDSDQYTLNWDPLPPLADSQMLFSAYNAWQAPALLYAAPLDPETNYTLGISTYSGSDSNPINGTALGLHSITFYDERANYTVPGWNGVPGSKKGGLIGGVVGGVIGAGIIGAIWFLCARRKRKDKGKQVQHAPKEVTSSTFEVDDDPYIELNDLGAARPTPYVTPALRVDTANTGVNTPSKAAIASASSSGQPLLSAHDDSALMASSADSAQQHTVLLSPAGLGSQHNLPLSPGGHSPTTAPSPGATLSNLPSAVGTGIGTGIGSSSEPVHPMAAELKHGDTLRRPRQRPVQVAQETDGGAVDEFELVPPVYNPAWAQERLRPGGSPGSSRFGSSAHLGADVEGVPLSPSVRTPPPALSVITTPYTGLSSNSTPPTTATTPHTATSIHAHVPSPLSTSTTHHPSLYQLPSSPHHPSSPLAMTNHRPPSDYAHSHPPSASDHSHYSHYPSSPG